MKTIAASNDFNFLGDRVDGQQSQTGPSFAAALCGFLSTTVATTVVMFLLSSV